MAHIQADRGADENGIHQADGTTVLQHVTGAPLGQRFYVSEQQLPVYQESAKHHGRSDLVFTVRR